MSEETPVVLIDSIEEVDEHLARANAIPEDERTEMWHLIVDQLLDRRNDLEQAVRTERDG